MRTKARRGIGWSAAAVVLLLLFAAGPANAGKVDPFWKVQKEMMKGDVSAGKSAVGALLIEVFIKTADVEKTKGRVEAAGGNVRTIVGKIMTASLPEKALEAAESWDEVEYIEAGKPMMPQNDLANASTSVASVQAGTGLTQGYDGTGVIVGVIDSGLDLTHPAFLDANGESRVLYVWDQTDATGPGPAEIATTYGTEFKHAAIVSGGLAEKDTSGHGTHVAGTAAGRDSAYPGVAPEASLVIVKTDMTSTGTSDAANYIFQKAAMLGRPAVINMSLGGHFGAHDGTSLQEQALDALVVESSGRSIVVAAGNQGGTDLFGYTGGIHTGFSVAAGSAGFTFFQAMPSELSYIDMWGPQECAASVGVGIYSGGIVDLTSIVANGSSTDELLYDGAVLLGEILIDRSEAANAQNGKWHTLIGVLPSGNYNTGVYEMFLVVDGSCSSFDAWAVTEDKIFFSNATAADVYPGGNSKTVAVPAAASKVVAVGAYATRTSWTDSSGAAQTDPEGNTVDALVNFSSRGPALESAQGNKPNVAAPGAYTISAYSIDMASPESALLIDSTHYAMPGTSMASPHVAGIVALLFQAYPSLTYSQVMSYLQNTASLASAPDANWGYGKVNALSAINAVLADYPPGSGSGDFSGISLTGIADGATDVSDTTQSFALTFPRAADTSTCGTSTIFVAPTTASASASKGAWNSTVCNSSSALAGTVSMTDSQNGTLTLDSALGSGTFAFCVSTGVRDSESISFGGKTVTFTTSSGGGGDGGGGGCRIAPVGTSAAAALVALALMLTAPCLARGGSRRNR